MADSSVETGMIGSYNISSGSMALAWALRQGIKNFYKILGNFGLLYFKIIKALVFISTNG
ncbi:MAG: hypothetical protein M3015_04775 [Bacteroidota bacterium]|nr:hypothetical protein [Bacteroidota bacterium]